MAETYYEVLGVHPDADRARIEEAYRDQVRRCHPDTAGDSGGDERIRAVNRAREVLTDPEERAQYDALGHTAYLHREVHAGPAPAGNTIGGTMTTEDGVTDGSRSTWSARAMLGESDRTREEGGWEDGHRPRNGTFVGREIVSTVLLVGLVIAAVVLVAGYREVLASHTPSVDGAIVFLGVWIGVALVAGELAAGGTSALPNDPIRVYAWPLALVILSLGGRGVVIMANQGMWYVRAGALVAAYGITLYGAYTALFRAAAAAGRSRWTLAPAGVWYVGSLPGALALYSFLFSVGGATSGIREWIVSIIATVVGPLTPLVTIPALLAVLAPLAIAVAHLLLVGIERVRAIIAVHRVREAR